ncbi:MAG: hypothetical protein ACI9W1_002230, partial [Candidatus Azotimanducaceae bacterium]
GDLGCRIDWRASCADVRISESSPPRSKIEI